VHHSQYRASPSDWQNKPVTEFEQADTISLSRPGVRFWDRAFPKADTAADAGIGCGEEIFKITVKLRRVIRLLSDGDSQSRVQWKALQLFRTFIRETRCED